MRLAALAAAIGGLAMVSSSFGAFTFQTTRTAATGAFAGLDRVNFIVSSDVPAYSFGALAFDIAAVGQPNGLKFRVPAVGNPDVYPPGFAGQVASTFDPGTKGTFGGYSAELGAVSLATPEPNAAAKPAFAAGLPTVNYVAFFTTPLEVTTADVPGGLVVGSAVVPAGTTVSFIGEIDSDLTATNGTTAFSVLNIVPEPATLGMLAGAALVAVRRRK